MTANFRRDAAVRRAWLGHKLKPFPWQREGLLRAIDAVCDGRKGIVRAATGSGKSILQAELCRALEEQLGPNERIIVSVPSQELVDQMMIDMTSRMPGKVGRWYEHERRLDRPIIVACHKSMYGGDVFCANCTASSNKKDALRPWPLFPLHGTALSSALKMIDCEENPEGKICQDPNPSLLASMSEDCLAGALRKKNLSVRLWIADEAHKTESRLVISFEHFAKPMARIGFTATPFRANQTERLSLFEEEIFEYTITQAILDEVIVPPRFTPYQGEYTDLDDACIDMISKASGPGIVNAWNIQDAEAFAQKLNSAGVKASAIHNRLSAPVRSNLLRRLERGDLHCLVHINLLAEGRNFPWLRWLCLRRFSVGKDNQGNEVTRTLARTRFIQEVGRVLRAYPGKKYAVIYDPNNLWSELALSYEAILGVDEDEIDAVRMRRSVTTFTRDYSRERDMSVVSIDHVEQYVQDRAQVFRRLGMMPFERIDNSSAMDESTTEQLARLRVLLVEAAQAKSIPEEERFALEAACRMAVSRQMRRGPLQDLLGILHLLKSFLRWPSLRYDDQLSPDV